MGDINNWIKIGQDIDGEGGLDEFGYSVDMNSSGTRIIIGGIYNDGKDENENSLPNSGHVRVFDLNGSGTNASWVQVGEDIDGENENDNSGYSVSMNSTGSRIIISAHNANSVDENGNSIDNTGHVRVFDLSGSGTNASWVQVGEDIDGVNSYDHFGSSVEMSNKGNRIAIGWIYGDGLDDSGNSVNYGGQVRVYDLSENGTNSSWIQVGGNIYGHLSQINFGHSLAMSSDGNRIIIGSPLDGPMDENFETPGYPGRVEIFDLSGSGLNASWVQVGEDIIGENLRDRFGYSVGMSSDGNRIVIGAPHNDRNNTSTSDNAGHVRVYEWNGSAWIKVGDDIDGENANDSSGYSVDISSDGNRIVFGADNADGSGNFLANSGIIRVFDLSGSGLNASWVQVGGDIDGEAVYAKAGSSVAMSADGTHLVFGATGAHGEDESGNIINYTGHARVYKYNSQTEETGDICFPAGTPVQTDQGEIAIEKLTCENTIDGVNVVAVVPVYNECDYLVKINKHALGPNYPKKTTLVSRNHRVFVDKKGSDKSVPALALYNGKTVTVVQREEHETIYNVLLPTYSKMTINGLVVETLHPKSVYSRKT